MEHIPIPLNPKLGWEQYPISTKSAAEILFIIDNLFNEIKSMRIADLGCGSGRLSIGAALLGANHIVAVDIDLESITQLKTTISKYHLADKISPVAAEISALRGQLDIVIQNPPFGIIKRYSDRKFIVKALQIAPVVYSLHKAHEKTRYFIKRFVEKNNGEVTHIFNMEMRIPHTFKHHRKRIYPINVDLYRMITNVEKR
jgi:putative methylase